MGFIYWRKNESAIGGPADEDASGKRRRRPRRTHDAKRFAGQARTCARRRSMRAHGDPLPVAGRARLCSRVGVRRRHGAPRHHALPGDHGARVRARLGDHRHRQRRQRVLGQPRRRHAQLRRRAHFPERLALHQRAGYRRRRAERVLPGHGLLRLGAGEQQPRAHAADRSGARHRRLGDRAARCLRHRKLQRGPGARAAALRQPGAELGRRHLHSRRHQRHQSHRRGRVPHPGRGAARGAQARSHAERLGVAHREHLARGLLSAPVEGGGDRPARHVFLHQRLRRCGRLAGVPRLR